MNTFIFQSVPEKYDLRKQLRPGYPDTWYATRYRNEMKDNDNVYFWLAGGKDIRGIYGWGSIVGAPYIRTSWSSHGINIEYRFKFKKPILATEFDDQIGLRTLLILRAPQATNFLLSIDEAESLSKFVKNRGETAPDVRVGL